VTGYVPPYPARPREPLPLLEALAVARRNFISIFEDRCFEYQFFSTRMLTRRIFVCNSPDTVAQAFIAMHESFERKTPQMRHALFPLVGDGLIISDGETWKRRRRIVAPIIHRSQLGLFAPVMVEAAAELADRWAARPRGEPLDMLREMGTLTAEVICRAVFGPRLGTEHAGEIAAAFSEYQQLVGRLDVPYLAGLPDWMPRPRSRRLRHAAARIHAVLDHVIAECRKRLAGGESSMIQLLLEARDPETGEALDPAALRNEAAVLFLAGEETTANSMAWTWFLLSQAPEVEARVHAELAQVLGGRLPALEDLPRLVFTRAVYEETLRLYPPIPMLGRQALRDEKIRNRQIPTGSLVVVVPWLLHRHRRLWEQPDHFIPERFLPENAASRQRYTYIPFSLGPRVCAGAAFGFTEAILCIATLAQRARLRLVAGAQIEPICRLTLRPSDALPMLVERRDET
jgi:cytochrome P450